MIWIVGILALLGLTITVIVIMGRRLPVKHTATASATFDMPVDVVWKKIIAFEDVSQWRPSVKQVEHVSGDGVGAVWRETGSDGKIPYQTLEMSPPRKLVRKIADPKLPFGGSWTYEITPNRSACTLTITENGEVYNPVFRFVSRHVMGHNKSIESYLKDLKIALAK